MKSKHQSYYVYILECADKTFYTGITNNLEQRIKLHNVRKGAKYTRGRTPVRLIYSEKVASKSEALKREIAIKKMGKVEKEKLVELKRLD